MSSAVAVVLAMCTSCLARSGFISILQPILITLAFTATFVYLGRSLIWSRVMFAGVPEEEEEEDIVLVTEILWGEASILVSGLTIISNCWSPYVDFFSSHPSNVIGCCVSYFDASCSCWLDSKPTTRTDVESSESCAWK